MQATKNTLFQSGRIQLIFFIKGPGYKYSGPLCYKCLN
jgi:hypothetical protein